MTQMLPRSSLNADLVPGANRFDALREAMAVLGDVRSRCDPATVSFRIDAFQLPGLVLGRQRGPALDLDRSRARVARDGIDHFVVQVLTMGTCHNRNLAAGGFEVARPGDVLIIDCSEPQSTAMGGHQGYSIVIPRRALTPLLRRPDGHHLLLLAREQPLAALLRYNIAVTFRLADRMTVVEAQAAVAPLLGLLASAINSCDGDLDHAAIDQTLLASIRAHVAENITDPGLAAADTAARFGISPRKLAYLFAPADGFAHYVQRQRLARCRALLADPQHVRRPIAEIAHRFGFTNPASFSRAFRRENGLTPREVRGYARSGWRVGEPSTVAGDDWWHWVANMH